MIKESTPSTKRKNEILFQVILYLIAFYLYVVDNERGRIIFDLEPFHFVYFSFLFVGNLLISYLFLPRFFYQKKYIQFTTYTLVTIIAMAIFEEFVLDPVIFPNTRESELSGALIGIFQYIPLLTILVGLKIARDSVVRQQELDRLKVMVKESELSFLNSQINPHFLFNNLNNLYALALEKSDKAPDLILGLSNLLRYMLYECREEKVPLEKEIHHLENFIKLYQLQIEDRGGINFSAEKINGSLQIAPLILNVFVENAFKHSQSGLSENIKIDIHAEVNQANELIFSCLNSFEKAEEPSKEAKGIGLINVRKRLELIYPGVHSLEITQSEKEYSVRLRIPLASS